MLTATDIKNLQNLLAMTEDPDNTFSFDELLGYLFGLAMTPEVLLPSEWMPLIFGGDLPESDVMEPTQKITGDLMTAYNKYLADFQRNQLTFPFTIDQLQDDQFAALYEWVSGFEEAIALREELWDPEEYPDLSEQKKEELYHSMMTIQGLVDPGEVMEYFEDMPDELFQEAFSGVDMDLNDREAQIQIFLLASLPLAIETFQEHARAVEKKRQRTGTGVPIPIRPAKAGPNAPCSCSSKEKSKKCCGSNTGQQALSARHMSSKKSNIIQVDFPQHGKKKSDPAPVYQMKVELQGAQPPIWRRFQVPGDITLDRLHTVLQLCMDWEELHLHQFLIGQTCYSIPVEDDLWQTSRPKNETHYTLHSLAEKIQPQFQYIYDFGDEWIHQITVEEVLPAQNDQACPLLISGRRACPPEDIGGIDRYMHILEVLKDPEDAEYAAMADILDMDYFDPAQFGREDIAEINALLQELFPPKK